MKPRQVGNISIGSNRDIDFACEYEKTIENIQHNFDVTQEPFQNLRAMPGINEPRLSRFAPLVDLNCRFEVAKHFENHERIFIQLILQEKSSTKQILKFRKMEKLES